MMIYGDSYDLHADSIILWITLFVDELISYHIARNMMAAIVIIT